MGKQNVGIAGGTVNGHSPFRKQSGHHHMRVLVSPSAPHLSLSLQELKPSMTESIFDRVCCFYLWTNCPD